jgi:hypothetical protein
MTNKTFKEFLAEALPSNVDYLGKSNITALKKELRKTLGIANDDMFMSFRGYSPPSGNNFDQIIISISVPDRELSDTDMFFILAKIAVDKCFKKYFPNPKLDHDRTGDGLDPEVRLTYRVDRNS